jgi:heparan-alpha-glucosaminide N-acetyltransferase
MTNQESAPLGGTKKNERVASLDALRGLIITLMIFVNDVAGSPQTPAWLRHVDANFDGMTLPDIVFPAFLFIAGMSIPLACDRAIANGQSRRQLLAKVLQRTLAMLVIGVVMVNGEEYDPWPNRLWTTLAFAAMFLTFAVVPSKPGRTRNILWIGRLVGIIALISLVVVYRNADGKPIILGPLLEPGDLVWLRHSWWGIIGLIAWAYLVASLVFLAVGARREWLMGAVCGLMLLYVAENSTFEQRIAAREWLIWASPFFVVMKSILNWINSHVGIGSMLGSLAGISVAGCCLGSILVAGSEIRSPRERLRWSAMFAFGLLILGVLFDGPLGINKIRATPAWCLYCAAITTLIWNCLYWLMDVRGVRAWGRFVEPAGENPLLAYLLHPFLSLVVGVVGGRLASTIFFYQELSMVPAALGSLMMAFVVVQATGWIAHAGYRLKV